MEETQKQKLMEFGKETLENKFWKVLHKIDHFIMCLENHPDLESREKIVFREGLREWNNEYQILSDSCKIDYGLEFPIIQEEYKRIRKDITKYLNKK